LSGEKTPKREKKVERQKTPKPPKNRTGGEEKGDSEKENIRGTSLNRRKKRGGYGPSIQEKGKKSGGRVGGG